MGPSLASLLNDSATFSETGFKLTDLFAPYALRGVTLRNRIVMAPMTRSRAPDDVANESMALYYAQRATAGLIVSEGTPISREGQGYLFNPGIFTGEQIKGWRLTTRSVHAVGGKIFAQLWHVGRVSHTSIQIDGAAPVSATGSIAKSAIAFGFDSEGKPGFLPASQPRALSTAEGQAGRAGLCRRCAERDGGRI
jgi:2,4-dienoyl-CoA reductase-like NADH-dependent reductase (Old Yellow Enzyme family)